MSAPAPSVSMVPSLNTIAAVEPGAATTRSAKCSWVPTVASRAVPSWVMVTLPETLLIKATWDPAAEIGRETQRRQAAASRVRNFIIGCPLGGFEEKQPADADHSAGIVKD